MSTLGFASLALGSFNGYHGRKDWKTTAEYLGLVAPLTTLVKWQDILEANAKIARPYPTPTMFVATVAMSAFMHGGLLCAGRFIGKAAKSNE
jgi:hypothetical protein